MPNFYSPNGNIEVWSEKPTGYFTEEEWEEKQKPIKEADEKARIDSFYADLSSAKKSISDNIDIKTSASIIAGFDYTYLGDELHFSYDSFDQQNFADTANACLLSMSGGANIPTTVTWNAYSPDGTLKQIELTAENFIALYTGGALAHKKSVMMQGGQRKAAVRDAADADALKALVDEWGMVV